MTHGKDEDSSSQPRHIRLYCEHTARQQRQEQRRESLAEWKKHSYRPDITTSQKTGPQIYRAESSGQQFNLALEQHFATLSGVDLDDLPAECLSGRLSGRIIEPCER